MADLLLDWTVVILPTLLGIVGLFFSLKAPHESAHRKWRYALVVAGVAISFLTYWQQSRSRNLRAAEVKEQKESVEKLQKMVGEAEARRETDSAFLRQKLDSKELAALSSAIQDYAHGERAKQTLDNKQLRERAFIVIRRMREFQLRYDFEESEISRRWLQGVREVERFGEAEMQRATQELETLEKAEAKDNPVAKERLGPTEIIAEAQKKIELSNKKLAALQKKIDIRAKWSEERRKINEKTTQEEKAMSERYQAEFKSSLLPEAAYIRDEILKRLPSQPEPTPPQAMQIVAFQGMLVGFRSVASAADYLENLARKLPRN